MTDINIPAKIDGVVKLMKARKWEKAAIVWAYVHCYELGEAHRPAKGAKTSTFDKPYTPEAFAALGIAGLRSKDTVRFYWEQWQNAIDQKKAKPVKPGDSIREPALKFPSSETRTGSGVFNRRVTEDNVRAAIRHDRGIAKAALDGLTDRAVERGREVQARARERGIDVDAPMPKDEPALPGELGVVAKAMLDSGEIQDLSTEVRNHLRAAKASMDVLISKYGYSGDGYTVEALTEASNLAIELAQQVMTFTMNAEVNK